MSNKPTVITIDKLTQMILKSFKAINKEIVFNTKETSVVHPEEKVIGLCKSFKMPARIGLTNLNLLLSSLKLIGSDQVEIFDNYMIIKSQVDDNKKAQRIHFHDNYDLIKNVDPGFSDALGDCSCEFELTSSDIKDIKEANRNLGGDNLIRFVISEDNLKISIGDDQPNAVADVCTIERPIEYEGDTFELIYTPSDFIFIDGDYEVKAYEHGLAVFKLKPIKVSDDEVIDVELYYFLTTGMDQ